MQRNNHLLFRWQHTSKPALFQNTKANLGMLLLILSTMLKCGSEWCDFKIVTVARNATIANFTGSTISVKYAINRSYEHTCCSNERKIPSTGFDAQSIDVTNGSSMTWTYSYWDSSECARSIIVLPGEYGETDTVFVTKGNENDTVFWPIDTSFFRYKTNGWVRWEADSGTIIYDTLVIEWKDSLVYGFR